MWLFGRTLTDRLRAFSWPMSHADFEAQLLARDAERKADLLRQAQKFDDEGLKDVAQHLRQQTQALGVERPLASVLPAIEHLQATERSLFPIEDSPAVVMLPAPVPQITNKKRKAGES